MTMMCFRDSVFGIGGAVFLISFACWITKSESGSFGSSFGFDIHHRYSPAVREFFDVDGLPEKGTLDYYDAMAHRDQLLNARRLTTAPPSSSHLTFLGSNKTIRSSSLGFLHYAFVSVGTPSLIFLVALDTGSDLFWLPCECTDCAHSLNTSSGMIELNIYSPSSSSTSMPVACHSATCGHRRCSTRLNACVYQAVYLSANTSTTGILVDDILHLGTNSNPQNPVDVPITLGCGIIQTGDFLDGAAINGLFGLGMNNLSVPSILASKGLTANSFSMCFGHNGLGRIDFGDKGSPDQKVTSFNLQQPHPSYNITVTQIALENNVTDLEFTAVFDSGTSFTYLKDPAYSAIVESFDPQITDPRYNPEREIIFNYCYALSANQDSYSIPTLNLTMKGGSKFFVHFPTVVIPREGGYAYCLAIVKSHDINIIGQNFMTGYRIVFDREKMVLGWIESDCYGSTSSKGSSTLPVVKGNNTEAPPPWVLDPEARPGNGTPGPASSPIRPRSPVSVLPSGSGNAATRFECGSSRILVILIFVIFHHLYNLYP